MMKTTGWMLSIGATLAFLVACASAPATNGVVPGVATAKVPEIFGTDQTVLETLRQWSDQKTEGFGWRVDISDDASVSALSAPYFRDPKDGYALGYVSLYERGKKAASFIGLFKDSLFGLGLSLSRKGDFLAVGEPGTTMEHTGNVYVFARPETGWQAGKVYLSSDALLSFHGAPGAKFGYSLAFSGDARTLVIGAPGEGGHGKVTYFLTNGSSWATSKDPDVIRGFLGLGDPKAGDEFGKAVAISGDNSTIAVGAPGRNGGKGAVYVFRKPQGGWPETQTLFEVVDAKGKVGDRFGEALALAADGKTLIVGGPGGQGEFGYARLDDENLSTNNYSLKMGTFDDHNVHSIGMAVDINGPATRAVVGMLAGTNNSGTALYFSLEKEWWKNAGSVFKVEKSVTSSDPFTGYYGAALSENGNILVVSSPLADNGVGRWSVNDFSPVTFADISWTVGLDTRTIPIKDLRPDQQKDWIPLLHQESYKDRVGWAATVQTDTIINSAVGVVTIAGGSEIRFITFNEKPFNQASLLKVQLQADTQFVSKRLKFPVTAGSTWILGGVNTFELSKATLVEILGTKLSLPAGTQVKLDTGATVGSEIVPKTPMAFSVGKNSITFNKAEFDEMGYVDFTLSKPARMVFGTLSFTAQAEAYVRIDGTGGTSYVNFPKGGTINSKGKNQSVPVSGQVEFKYNGEVTYVGEGV
jgi:hypothetical protein